MAVDLASSFSGKRVLITGGLGFIGSNPARRLVEFPEERKRIDIGDYYGDYTKICTELGWQPQIKLRDGIARTLEYYRQHKKHYW